MRLSRDRRLSIGPRAASLAVAVLALVLATAVAPPPVAAADGIRSTASTTYELVPAKGILRVTIDLKIANRVPSGSRTVPCTQWAYDPWIGYYPVTGTCRQRIDYYVDSTVVWLESSARKIRLTANSGAVKRSVWKRVEGYVGYKLAFANLFNGQTRTIRVTYELPGGAPRSATATRIGRAYANFCVIANGIDGGSVRVSVPKDYEFEVQPAAMTRAASGSRVVHRSGPISDTAGYYRCFEGTNDAGFARVETTSASGRAITIESWPEDREWLAAVGASVETSVDRLEQLLGRSIPGWGPITIREVSDSELGSYAGTFDPSSGIARIGETFDEPGIVAHELSHAWFNDRSFAARWLSEGLAQWAEQVDPSAGEACTAPGPYPGKGSVDLDEWSFAGPRSTPAEREVVAYQYDASCWITTALAQRMGGDRMADVVRAMLDGRAAYDAAAPAGSALGWVDWRRFLDLVDERGLVPAGVTDLRFAERLLLDYGVADRTALAGRAEARAAYHDLVADLGGWAIPAAIRGPLEGWRFREAQEAIRAGASILAAVAAADAALPGIDAADGPARAAFEQAGSVADLVAAEALASSQLAAATDVAGALAALDEPPDELVEQIGLWGVELGPTSDAAVAAVRAADADRAAGAAWQIRATLAGAGAVGTQRVAVGAGVIIVLLVGIALAAVVVRRRRRPAPALVGAGATDLTALAPREEIAAPDEQFAPWAAGEVATTSDEPGDEDR